MQMRSTNHDSFGRRAALALGRLFRRAWSASSRPCRWGLGIVALAAVLGPAGPALVEAGFAGALTSGEAEPERTTPAAVDGPQASALLIDGSRVEGRWKGGDAKSVRIAEPGGTVTIDANNLEYVQFRKTTAKPSTFEAGNRYAKAASDAGLTQALPAGESVFHLADSGRLFGTLLRSEKDALIAKTTLGPELTLPFGGLAAIRLADSNAFPKAAEALEYALLSRPPGRDMLITRDLEDVRTVQGRLESVGPIEGSFHFGDSARSFETEKIFAIVFAAGPKRESVEPLTVQMVDGAAFSGRLVEADTEFTEVQASFDATVRVPLAVIAQLRFHSDRVVFLSDLRPSAENREGRLHSPRPVRFDRNAANGPIVLDGRAFDRGIGMMSRTELTFELDGRYEAFVATLGIDDSVRPRGSVIFRVKSDNNVLFDSGLITGDDRSIDVNVSLQGVSRLKLVADFGDELDLSDYANWGGAKLLRPARRKQ